ncbi:MAG: DUF4396 domain-containing protein [Pseudomonadota bacterium]
MEHADHCAHSDHVTFKIAAHATVHCLIGCAIGEFIGLSIGVSLGLKPLAITLLAVVCAYISGFTFATYTLIKKRNIDAGAAFRVIWLGELISIAAMEIAMNITDYLVGGMHAKSMLDPIFWVGYGAALVAGYIAALPVNYALLKRELKHCH